MINLNDTTPAAPAGGTNVKWQEDVSGNVSAYAPSTATQTAAEDLTAQAADITPTTFSTPTASGVFRVSGYIVVTQVATTSSTLPSIVITWVDADNSTPQSLTLTPTSAGNLLTTFEQATGFISDKAANAIQFATSGYASSGATPMQFALHLRLETF